MTAPIRCDPASDSCHLCGDEAIVARVVSVDTTARTAIVALPEGQATVGLDFVDAVAGDQVLVHLGFAIERTRVA